MAPEITSTAIQAPAAAHTVGADAPSPSRGDQMASTAPGDAGGSQAEKRHLLGKALLRNVGTRTGRRLRDPGDGLRPSIPNAGLRLYRASACCAGRPARRTPPTPAGSGDERETAFKARPSAPAPR